MTIIENYTGSDVARGEQGPRPLLSRQDRIEKLATGKTGTTTGQIITNKTTAAVTSNVKIGQQQWKITKDTVTVGTWNVQTLWAIGKLELLRNEMKRFRFDVIRISEVRWTGKGEISSGDFIWPGEDSTHTRGVGMLLSAKAKKTLIGYNPISSRVITARFDATSFKRTVIHVYTEKKIAPHGTKKVSNFLTEL
ncbi:unnamed protein product [Rotaria socialis]|uniref:Craniofacial development protein 2-like n=1 Tax=Rotaria socialis TaxID=392032 RepID=A0A817X3I0_9BILA|nr:unnamed protein product [Rotaria socialis]CAF4773147.1 unnamed protein product [Rotaria socialis]